MQNLINVFAGMISLLVPGAMLAGGVWLITWYLTRDQEK
jgi:hypothetical protein